MRTLTVVLLCLLVFVIPLENMLVIPGLGTISRLIGGGSLVAGLFAVLSRKEHRAVGGLLILYLLYLVWSGLTFLWTIDYESSWISFQSLLQLFIFMWLIWEFSQREKDLFAMMGAYVAGCMISCLATFMAYQNQTQFTYQRYAASGFDPNDLGVALAVGIPLAWYLFVTRANRWGWVTWAYVPVAGFAIVLTASRTAFIALAVALISVLLTLYRARGWSRWFVYLCLPVCLYLGYRYVPDYSLDRVVSIGEEVSSGTLNSRMDIWNYGIRAFAERPIHGFGVGSFSSVIEHGYGFRISAHNVFVSALVSEGLIGLLLVAGMFVNAGNALRAMPMTERLLWGGVLLSLGVGVSALSWDHSKPTWLLLSLLVSHAGLYRHNEISLVNQAPDTSGMTDSGQPAFRSAAPEDTGNIPACEGEA